jgi:hypothetical protein
LIIPLSPQEFILYRIGSNTAVCGKSTYGTGLVGDHAGGILYKKCNRSHVHSGLILTGTDILGVIPVLLHIVEQRAVFVCQIGRNGHDVPRPYCTNSLACS